MVRLQATLRCGVDTPEPSPVYPATTGVNINRLATLRPSANGVAYCTGDKGILAHLLTLLTPMALVTRQFGVVRVSSGESHDRRAGALVDVYQRREPHTSQ